MVRVSLYTQVLGTCAIALFVLSVAVGLEAQRNEEQQARFAALTQIRDQLDRHVARVTDRHDRTVRRVREALIGPKPIDQLRVLSSSAQDYLPDMDRIATDARTAMQNLWPQASNEGWSPDLDRLMRQFDRVHEQAGEVAPILAEIVDAVGIEDDEALRTGVAELNRVDREMNVALRNLAAFVRHLALDQARPLTTVVWFPASLVWLLSVVGAAAALLLSARPLAWLRRLSQGRLDAPRRTTSPEELALLTQAQAAQHERQVNETLVAERERQAERTSQSVRRLERDLAIQRLYNDNLVGSLRSGVIVTDAVGSIASINRTARVLFGVDENVVASAVEAMAFYGKLVAQRPEAKSELKSTLDSKRTVRFEGVSVETAGGERLVDFTVAPNFDETGAARGLLWIADDVTDAVRLRGQLVAAERLAAVGRMSAQVAHEIRNPLSAIGLNVELLNDEVQRHVPPEAGAEAQSLVRAVMNELERLRIVTDGYLQLARLPKPQFQDTDLNQMVAELMAMLSQEMKAHHIEVVLELASPPLRAWADPGQLRQALLNIIRNSREAMSQGGTLRIGTEAQGDHSRIWVSDTGGGIPAEHLPRIFEPFFTTKSEGTGLGLSLTRQIVDDHQGSVAATSAPQGGTTMVIDLPQSAPRPD